MEARRSSSAVKTPAEDEIASPRPGTSQDAADFVLDDAGSIEIREPTKIDKYFITFVTFGAQLSLVSTSLNILIMNDVRVLCKS